MLFRSQNDLGGDDFIANKSAYTSYQLVLEMHKDKSKLGETQFYFKEGLSLGIDAGYDAGAFEQDAALSSRLIEGGDGINFAINAMDVTHIDGAIIPLILHQEEGQKIKIGIANSSLLQEVNVYLEDRLKNTLTLLQEKDFEITTASKISGAGRFYIYLSTKTLSNDSVHKTLLYVYKSKENNFISIEGIAPTATTINLYTILGKVVRTKVLTGTNDTLSTSDLSSGIYSVKVKANNQILTKKILID